MMYSKKGLVIDPRVKLMIITVMSVLFFSRTSRPIDFIFLLFICLLLILAYQLKKACFIFGAYVLSYYLLSFLINLEQNLFVLLVIFILTFYRFLMIPLAVGVLVLTQTTVGEWVFALKKIGIPQSALIPFVVVCRFFPSLKQDFMSIRQATRIRGIAVSVRSVIRHPILTLEYLIVPLLMSVDRAAMELSAAALVRGLGNEGPHSSLYQLKLKWQDYLIVIILFAFIIVERCGVLA